jgi:hypothetical protein
LIPEGTHPEEVDGLATADVTNSDGVSLAGVGAEPHGLQGAGSVRAVVGRAALIIVAATLTGRLLGLVRDIVVAYFFGAQSEADAFFLAYKVPHLLSLVVSSALVAAFVPMFSHRIFTGNKKEALGLFVNMGKVACLVLIALTVILIVLAPWVIPLVGFGFDSATKDLAVYLFRILMIGFSFAGLTGLVTGMLNSLRRFAVAAFAPAVEPCYCTHHHRSRSVGITLEAIGTATGWVVGLPSCCSIRDREMRYRARIEGETRLYARPPGWRPVFIGSSVGAISIFSDQILVRCSRPAPSPA